MVFVLTTSHPNSFRVVPVVTMLSMMVMFQYYVSGEWY